MCALAAASGCEREAARVEEQRRELLVPPDHKHLRAERQERERIFDDEGIPLESEQLLAGFPMPRGFVVTRESSNEWFLESQVVSAERAARYVEKRVLTERISRDGSGGVSFDLVALRSDPNAPKRRITVTTIAGMENASEIFITKPDLSPDPPKARPSFAQSEAVMEAQRKHAD
jgi:hypothetical protein